MTEKTKSNLTDEFLHDHQKMSRLLFLLHQAVHAEDIGAARQLAEELDRVAGPHIEFEESVLYPLVGISEGLDFEKQLRKEHGCVVNATRQLIQLPNDESATPDQLDRWKSDMDAGMRHVESCGTLISYLSSLNDEQQSDALKKLLEFREKGRRWSELVR